MRTCGRQIRRSHRSPRSDTVGCNPVARSRPEIVTDVRLWQVAFSAAGARHTGGWSLGGDHGRGRLSDSRQLEPRQVKNQSQTER